MMYPRSYIIRMVRELQMSYTESDAFSHDLAVEAQNGRLFRLLAKILYINERPEFDSDPQCMCRALTGDHDSLISPHALLQGRNTVIVIPSNCSETLFFIRFVGHKDRSQLGRIH